jgi:hypothetical protein
MDKYWGGKGRYQALYDKLSELIPDQGNIEGSPALEKLRRASNCYYDLFNNGLCNRAKEFRQVFGFAGTWIAKEGFPYVKDLENKMDAFILAAAKEQRIIE